MKLEPKDIRPGDELYVGTQWSIDHGQDDMCGGIAIVKGVRKIPHCKTLFIDFENLDHSPNAEILLAEQEEMEKSYGNRIAHMCPDGQRCPNPIRPWPIRKIVVPTRTAVASRKC